MLAAGAEIVVMRSQGGIGPWKLHRARVATVLEGPTGRFTYRLAEADPDGAVDGSRSIADEGVTWALGWDEETAGALLAAHALADVEARAAAQPDLRTGSRLYDIKTAR